MVRVLVIGYGNTLRGDDGVGFVAAEQLNKTITRPDVRVLACQQLTPELAKDVSDAERVILIDAAKGDPPGNILLRKITPIESQLAFAHELRPETLLAFSRRLFNSCPETVLVSVTGHSFKLGEGLSNQVRRTLPKLSLQVLELMKKRRAKANMDGIFSESELDGDLGHFNMNIL